MIAVTDVLACCLLPNKIKLDRAVEESYQESCFSLPTTQAGSLSTIEEDEQAFQELAKESRSLVLDSQSPNTTSQYRWGVNKFLNWNYNIGKYPNDNITKLKYTMYAKWLATETKVNGTERNIRARTVSDALTQLNHLRQEQIDQGQISEEDCPLGSLHVARGFVKNKANVEQSARSTADLSNILAREITDDSFKEVLMATFTLPKAMDWCFLQRFYYTYAVATAGRNSDVTNKMWYHLIFLASSSNPAASDFIGPDPGGLFVISSAQGKSVGPGELRHPAITRGFHIEDCAVSALADLFCQVFGRSGILTLKNLRKGYIVNAPHSPLTTPMHYSTANEHIKDGLVAGGVQCDLVISVGDKHQTCQGLKKFGLRRASDLGVSDRLLHDLADHDKSLLDTAYLKVARPTAYMVGGYGPEWKDRHFIGRSVIFVSEAMRETAVPGLSELLARESASPGPKSSMLRVLEATDKLRETFCQDLPLKLKAYGEQYSKMLPQIAQIQRLPEYQAFSQAVFAAHARSLDQAAAIRESLHDPVAFQLRLLQKRVAEAAATAFAAALEPTINREAETSLWKADGGMVVSPPAKKARLSVAAPQGELIFTLKKQTDLRVVVEYYESLETLPRRSWMKGGHKKAYSRFGLEFYTWFSEQVARTGRELLLCQIEKELKRLDKEFQENLKKFPDMPDPKHTKLQTFVNSGYKSFVLAI